MSHRQERTNTIIFSIRNREVSRVYSLVESIRKNGIESPILLTDFGSFESFSSQYKDACEKLNIGYVKTHTEGRPWSRGQALNTGIRCAQTPFVTTTDVDMLFDANPYDFIFEQSDFADTVFYIMPYWLNKRGEKSKAVCAGSGSTGGFQFIAKKTVDELGGYDERIKYWGMEDCDWTHRLRLCGKTLTWLPEPHRIFHKWHPNAEGGFLRPKTAEYDSMRRYYENTFSPKLTGEYGALYTEQDRAILQFVKNDTLCATAEKPFVLNFNKNDFASCFTTDTLLNTVQKEPFVQLNLQNRLDSSPILSFNFARKLVKPFTIATRTVLLPRINNSFDFFYAAVLPVLQRYSVTDYYITSNFENIFLIRT